MSDTNRSTEERIADLETRLDAMTETLMMVRDAIQYLDVKADSTAEGLCDIEDLLNVVKWDLTHGRIAG